MLLRWLRKVEGAVPEDPELSAKEGNLRGPEMVQGGEEGKPGGADGRWDGISGVVVGRSPVSVADGYLQIPVPWSIYGPQEASRGLPAGPPHPPTVNDD